MGVLLQGFFQYNNRGVPCPYDGDAGVEWWWDHIASQASSLASAGFSAIWLPPITKGASGIQSIGYDVFDDYDIGAKNQMGTIPTRYGTREQLQRCAAILRANGIDVYLDVVNHQRDGGNDYVYSYLGAGGMPDAGRFPKVPLDFHPNVPPDSEVLDTSIEFGDDLSTSNSVPPGYVFNGLIEACDWYTRTLGLQGYRFDDAKGISANFTLALATSKSMAGNFVVGELISNTGDISTWVFNWMNGKASAFDYPLHFALSAMCNNPGGYDISQLDNFGFTAGAPFNSVTFVENHDTDSNPQLNPVIVNKALGYAYIMTIEGYPSVYYRDYCLGPYCYGLKPIIDNLIWIHEKLAAGTTTQRWKDFNVFAYERLGSPGLLVGLNNDPNNVRTISVATNFGPGVTLHDYTGHSGDVVTGFDGSVDITIPRNVNGLSYVCYSRTGIGGGFNTASNPATQQFDGAADLDIPPATNGQSIAVGRVWCDAGSDIRAALSIDRTAWTKETNVNVTIVAPDGTPIHNRKISKEADTGTSMRARTGSSGYYTLNIQSESLPEGTAPYTLSVTYTAPRLLDPAAT